MANLPSNAAQVLQPGGIIPPRMQQRMANDPSFMAQYQLQQMIYMQRHMQQQQQRQQQGRGMAQPSRANPGELNPPQLHSMRHISGPSQMGPVKLPPHLQQMLQTTYMNMLLQQQQQMRQPQDEVHSSHIDWESWDTFLEDSKSPDFGSYHPGKHQRAAEQAQQRAQRRRQTASQYKTADSCYYELLDIDPRVDGADIRTLHKATHRQMMYLKSTISQDWREDSTISSLLCALKGWDGSLVLKRMHPDT
jgi:hypothetical protein